MNRVVVALVVTGLMANPPLAYGQPIKVFDEDECSFILPGEGWEWLDPTVVKSARTLALARNENGILVVIGAEKLDKAPAANHYESFDYGFFKSGKLKKISAKHITFKGVPGYFIESEGPPGVRGTAWVVCANYRDYVIQVVDATGDPLLDHEPFIRGFAFTKEPRATVKPNGENTRDFMLYVYVIGLVIAIIMVTVRMVRKRASS